MRTLTALAVFALAASGPAWGADRDGRAAPSLGGHSTQTWMRTWLALHDFEQVLKYKINEERVELQKIEAFLQSQGIAGTGRAGEVRSDVPLSYSSLLKNVVGDTDASGLSTRMATDQIRERVLEAMGQAKAAWEQWRSVKSSVQAKMDRLRSLGLYVDYMQFLASTRGRSLPIAVQLDSRQKRLLAMVDRDLQRAEELELVRSGRVSLDADRVGARPRASFATGRPRQRWAGQGGPNDSFLVHQVIQGVDGRLNLQDMPSLSVDRRKNRGSAEHPTLRVYVNRARPGPGR